MLPLRHAANLCQTNEYEVQVCVNPPGITALSATDAGCSPNFGASSYYRYLLPTPRLWQAADANQ